MLQAFRYKADMHNGISNSAPQDNVLGSKSFIERHEHRRGRVFMITLYG